MSSTLVFVSTVPLTYLGTLFVQSLLATMLFVLLGLAYYQRRSRPYLLVWLGVSTLFVESLVGIVGLLTTFDPMSYIVLDRGLDILFICLLFGAVHSARRVESVRTQIHDTDT